jgi:pimeloyl-ACP methyl ester carboxylesterase/DNA-binding CsgD family transcriptional regulator
METALMAGQELQRHVAEDDLIKEAYALTLEPDRLEEYEAFWESYVDSQESTVEAGLGNSQVNVHVLRALEIVEHMRHQPTQTIDIQSIIDLQHGFAIIVDRFGQIVARNRTAQSLFSKARSISDLDWAPDVVRRVSVWLDRLGKSAAPTPMFIHEHLQDLDRKSCLFLAPFNVEGDLAGDGTSHAMVTDVEFDISDEALLAIRQTFGLTQAEADVAVQLAQGLSPDAIARLRDVSIHTVRTQIKQVLAKTDSSSIPVLVKHLCGMSARIGSVASQTALLADKWRNASEYRVGGMTLSDGRYLEYTEMGHPRGRPVVYIHHAMSGPRLTLSAVRECVLKGWRIIAPSRPGYGNSDLNLRHGFREVARSWVADLRELFANLGLSHAIVIGIGAEDFSLAHPDLVKGIVLINHVRLWNPAMLEYYGPRERSLIKASLHAPRLVAYPPRITKILFDTGRERIFIDGLNKGNRIDREAREDPEVYEALVDGFRNGLKQGVRAFVQDVEAIHTDFSEEDKRLTRPVTVVYAGHTGHQAEQTFLDFQRLVPHARLRKVEGAGTYLQLTHFSAVLEELERF